MVQSQKEQTIYVLHQQKFDYSFDIADNSVGIFIGSNGISKLEIDGKVITSDKYVVRNNYLLLKSFNDCGKGNHLLKVTYKTKTAEFNLKLDDKKDLKYDVSVLNNIVVPVSSSVLPKVNFLADNQEKTVTYSVSSYDGQKNYQITEQADGNKFTPDLLGKYKYSVKIERDGDEVYNNTFDVVVCEDLIYNSFVKKESNYSPAIFEIKGDSVVVNFSAKGIDNYTSGEFDNIIGFISKLDSNYIFNFDNNLAFTINNNTNNKDFITGMKIYGSFIKRCAEAGLNAVTVDYNFIGYKANYTQEQTLKLYTYSWKTDTYSPLNPGLLYSAWGDGNPSVNKNFFSVAGLYDMDDDDYVLLDIPRNANVIQINSITFNNGIKDVNLDVFINGEKQDEYSVSEIRKNILNEIAFITPVNNVIDISSITDKFTPDGCSILGESVLSSEIADDGSLSYKLYFVDSGNLNLLKNFDKYFTLVDKTYLDSEGNLILDGNGDPVKNSAKFNVDGSVTMIREYGWDNDRAITFNQDALQELYNKGYNVIYVEYVADKIFDSVGYANFYTLTYKNGAWEYIDHVGIDNVSELGGSSSGRFVITQQMIEGGIKLSQFAPSTITIKSITAIKSVDVEISIFANGEEQDNAKYSTLCQNIKDFVNKYDVYAGEQIDISSVAIANGPVGFSIDNENSVLVSKFEDGTIKYSICYLSATEIDLIANGYDAYFTVDNGGANNNKVSYDSETGTITLNKQSGWSSLPNEPCLGLVFKANKLQELFNKGYTNITVVYSVQSSEVNKDAPLSNAISFFFTPRIKNGGTWSDLSDANGFVSVLYNAGDIVDDTIEYTGTFTITKSMAMNGLMLNQNCPGNKTVIRSIKISKAEYKTYDENEDKIIEDVNWEK